MYSTDQMQGIRLTRFKRVVNAFVAAVERVYRCKRTRLSLWSNAFIAASERVYRCGRTRLSLRLSAFIAGNKRVRGQTRLSRADAFFTDTTANGFVADSAGRVLEPSTVPKPSAAV